ncbi:hypothetical protein GCM10022224_056930 [Nonomuraea antimicrobica]|uniref:Uncharacterized protein n=1 Tax=Nonomuraea antimicrobica TaxID=561173 RepID=A0ABP7CA09_9ACTN
MIALYPQFLPTDQPLLVTTALLALFQVAVEIVLYLALAAVSGTTLVALGLRMVVEGRCW